jgi:hypothetical protein
MWNLDKSCVNVESGKAFNNAKCFVKHEQSDTRERPNVCKYVVKPSLSLVGFYCQERTHTGEQAYLYEQCGKAFSSWRRHCGKGLSWRKTLCRQLMCESFHFDPVDVMNIKEFTLRRSPTYVKHLGKPCPPVLPLDTMRGFTVEINLCL